MTNTQIYILIIAAAYLLFAIIRDWVVTKAQREERRRAHENDIRDVFGIGRKPKNHYVRYDALPRERMIWMVTKWTHGHFYDDKGESK